MTGPLKNKRTAQQKNTAATHTTCKLEAQWKHPTSQKEAGRPRRPVTGPENQLHKKHGYHTTSKLEAQWKNPTDKKQQADQAGPVTAPEKKATAQQTLWQPHTTSKLDATTHNKQTRSPMEESYLQKAAGRPLRPVTGPEKPQLRNKRGNHTQQTN